MRKLFVLAALLITPAAFAQTTILLKVPFAPNCPVGIRTQLTPQGAVQQVRSPGDHHKLAYNITLRALDTRLIAQARVTLLGLSGAQVVPVAEAASANATETFLLTPGASPQPSFDSVVYTQKLTGVRFIQIDEVTYADGTQWHQTADHVCRVAPSAYLLVNATN